MWVAFCIFWSNEAPNYYPIGKSSEGMFLSLCKLCKLLIDCLKSPFYSKLTNCFSSILTSSFWQIDFNFYIWTERGIGLNLNLTQRDDNGSMILL
jgi:hypothetical protein